MKYKDVVRLRDGQRLCKSQRDGDWPDEMARTMGGGLIATLRRPQTVSVAGTV